MPYEDTMVMIFKPKSYKSSSGSQLKIRVTIARLLDKGVAGAAPMSQKPE
jgi:hypothetical protein